MTTSKQSSLSTWAPFRVTPQFVERVWGVNDLRPWYDEVAKGNPIGEAWLTGDECEVATGPHAGGSWASFSMRSRRPCWVPVRTIQARRCC